MPIRQSVRPKKAPAYLSDFHCNVVSTTNTSHTSPLYPLCSILSYSRLSPSHLHYTLSISTHTEPTSYKQAVQHDQWIKAMNDELAALHQNHTWLITDLPLGKKPIGCKWVYNIKYKANGDIERHMARLVAKGFNQVEGIDFFDIYSTVAKLTTIRLLLAIASSQNWFLHQLDVHNAFLHGTLAEDVYMQLPPGLKPSKPNQVCKLLKSIYGLKQSSRQWFSSLSTFLICDGFVQSTSDYSLFTKQSNSSFTAILVYVDDLILAGNHIHVLNNIKATLNSKFKIKDLGNLKFFLGLEIARSKEGIHICQRKYALDMLSECGLLASKPVSSPMIKVTHLCQEEGTVLANPLPYRRLVGKLIYLTTTRPDISFSVQ